jgi:hypothetical protein
MDEVLFRLGQVLDYAGRSGEALPYLDRLVREYADSEFAEEARKLMAELQNAPPPASPVPTQPSPSPSPSPTPPAPGQ